MRPHLTAQHFQEAKPPPSGRGTVLKPELVVWLMIIAPLYDSALSAAMPQLWAGLRGLLDNLPANPLTEEAFCIARKRLPLAFLKRLFIDHVQRFRAQHGHRWRFHGLNVRSIDGTDIDVPNTPDLARRFKPPTNLNDKRPTRLKAQLVALLDTYSGLCSAFTFHSTDIGEGPCAVHIIKRHVNQGDLILADALYSTVPVMGAIAARRAHFVIRLKDSVFKNNKRRPIRGGHADEGLMRIKASPKTRARYGRGSADSLIVRVLTYQRDGFRPGRLITNLLDAKAFPYEELLALYHDRWRHETAYREMKGTLKLGALRSRTYRGVCKEIFVGLLLSNLIRHVQAEAVEVGGGSLRPVDLSFVTCRRLVVQAMTMMSAASGSREKQLRLYQRLLLDVADAEIHVRPGRSYARKDDKTRHKGKGKMRIPRRIVATSLNIIPPAPCF